MASIGNDPRGYRFFHTTKQGEKYDAQGEYVRHWVPELAQVPASHIHKPWELAPDSLKLAGVVLGQNYPEPRVPLIDTAKANEIKYKEALKAAKKHPANSRIRKFVR